MLINVRKNYIEYNYEKYKNDNDVEWEPEQVITNKKRYAQDINDF